MLRPSIPFALTAVLLLGGCAETRQDQTAQLGGEVAALRAELQRAQQNIAANDQKIGQLEARTQAAEQQAALANQRAETIYNRSLRK